jgi:hypothetical protein
MEGLPGGVRAACREAGEPARFAGALIELLRLTPEERRGIAAQADLAALSWDAQLAPMLALLEQAAHAAHTPARW